MILAPLQHRSLLGHRCRARGAWLLAAIAVALLGACSGTPPRLGAAKLEPIATALPMQRLWTAVDIVETERRGATLPLTVADGKAYWIDGAGILRAFSAADGKRLWTFDTKGRASSAVGRGEGRLFIGTRDGEVLALEEATGLLRWRGRVSSEVLSPPQAAQGVVVVHSVDGRVAGLSLDDGHRIWDFESSVPLLTVRGTSAPVIDGDYVFVGLANGKLAALKLFDGGVRWQVEIATARGRSELERMVDVDATPALGDGTVYTVAFQGRLAALNAATGRVLWSRDLSSSLSLALDRERVYATDDEGNIWALFQRNGTVHWKQDALHGRGLTAPAVYGDYVVVGDADGYLHWLAIEDGHIIHRQRLDDTAVARAPVAGEGALYTATRGGVLDAQRLPTP